MGITDGIEKTSGGLFRKCAIWMLMMPTTVAPRNEPKTIPRSKCMAENLINPPMAPIPQMAKMVLRGTLNRMANPMAAIPDQILLVIISIKIILKV